MVQPERKSDPSGRATRWPNLLVIGAARSGTTALVRSLEQHPDIVFTEPKETHFFAHPNQELDYQGPGDSETVNTRGVTNAEKLERQFAAATQRILGEGSVETLFWPDVAVPTIKAFADPKVKLVAILREPADRAYSAFLYLRGRGFETHERFEDGLEAEAERRASNFQHMWSYRAQSAYETQLPAFIEPFGDRLHVMIFEEFRTDPATELSRLCDFLDIDGHHDLVLGRDVNRGGEPTSHGYLKMIKAIQRSALLRNVADKAVPEAFRERVRNAKLQRPEADPATMAALYDEFAPTRSFVEAHLGRSVAAWERPR